MKKSLKVFCRTLIVFLGFSSAAVVGGKEIAGFNAEDFEVANNPKQYIGYGYDVAGGKAISDDDALFLNNPILDLEGSDVLKKTKIFNGSQTVYQSDTCSSAQDVAESMGNEISGGIGAKIKVVNVDINTKFNTKKSWTNSQKEEYSYYSIFAKNKPVVLQMDIDEIRECLSENFKKDLLAVKDEATAQKLYKKYGTHLLTGYTLGGIFEMTNYFSTQSSSYVKENTTSFSTSINASFANYGASTDFSFAQSYGSKDNNSLAVSNYKCNTYGGLAFPGLTIDQAFSWYETMFKAGYVYDIWTDSINQGQNLVIVDVPQSSEMIPLWDLLPLETQYNDARKILLEKYISNCGGVYKEFVSSFPKARITDRTAQQTQEASFGVEEKGYTYYRPTNDGDNEYLTTYVDTSTSTESKTSVIKGSIIAMDFNEADCVGANLKWYVKGNDLNKINIIDERNGIFELLNTASGDIEIYLDVNGMPNNGGSPFKTFTVKENSFYGGTGSEESPYLISNLNELIYFSQHGEKRDPENHFKLISDIDLSNIPSNNKLRIIGPTKDDAFCGVFDGNYHTISGLDIDYNNMNEFSPNGYYGLFGVNKGTIKNLRIAQKEGGIRPSVKNHPGRAGLSRSQNYEIEKIDAILSSSSSDEYYLKGIKQTKTSLNEIKTEINTESNYNPINKAAILCSLNCEGATIDNCFVENCDVSIYNKSQVTGDDSSSWINAGVLTAVNEGEIINCQVKDCGVSIISNSKIPTTGSTYNKASVGGISGTCNTSGKIENSLCEHSNFLSYVGDTTDESVLNHKLKESYVGGIVGFNNGIITNCLAKRFDSTNPYNGSDINASSNNIAFFGYFDNGIPNTRIASISVSSRNIAATNLAEKTNYSITCAGGLVGSASSSSTISKSVVYSVFDDSVYSMETDNCNKTAADYQNASFKGSFGGKIPNNNVLQNCYIDKTNAGKIIQNHEANDLDSETNQFTSDKILVGIDHYFSSLPSAIIDDKAWNDNADNNFIELVKHNFDNTNPDNIYFNFENAKKSFYIGDSFSSGLIEISGTDENGEDFDITEYTINYSDFVNKMALNMNVEAEIKVSAYGIEDSYIVTILKPEITGIFVAEEPTGTFYEGDGDKDNPLSFEGLVVKYRLENGVEVELTSEDYILQYNELVPGFNEIKVIYKDKFLTSFYVEAEELKIESVKAKVPSSKTYTFTVGTQYLDFGNLEVEVAYDKNNKVRVYKWNKCDLIYSRIQEGNNDIAICYGGYDIENKDIIKATGVYTATTEQVNLFVNSVNELTQLSSLNDQYKMYKQVLKYKNDIGEYSTPAIESAKAKLKQFEETYETNINNINEDFFNSIYVAHNVIYSTVSNKGNSLLIVIINWLRNVLFN